MHPKPNLFKTGFPKLIQTASSTEWGTKYDYKHLNTYKDFQRVPVQTYEDIKGYVDRMRHGESNVLWPGKVVWYAKSSGTTNDKSKFIPVSKDGLHHVHYMGGTDAVALYLQQNPQSRFFSGKGLILGGSHSPNYNVKDSLVGDLSAILIQNINPLVNFIRTPSKEIALLSEFEEKVERIAETTIHQNVTNLSGVPSWMLAVIKRILEKPEQKHSMKYGLTWKFSSTEAFALLLTANNTRSLSRPTKCITWRLIMPVKVSSDCRTI